MIEKQPIRAVEGDVHSSDFSSIEDINPVGETVEPAVPSPETFIPVPTASLQPAEAAGVAPGVGVGYPLSAEESDNPAPAVVGDKINNRPIPSKY
ncbi:MAG: hypothetical protein ACOX0P_02415 [Candidatus Dojkabacteria bacterium]